MTTGSIRFRTGLAATLLGSALVLPLAGTAVAGDTPPGPPEDKISMACSAVRDADDPSAAAALALYGIQSEDVKGKVGFFCTPTSDPKEANFCAIANQKDAFLALGKEGACAAGQAAPLPATPGVPEVPDQPTTPTQPTPDQPGTPTQPGAPTQPGTPAQPPAEEPPAQGAPNMPPPPAPAGRF